MAVDDTPDPLERATLALRNEGDEGWIEVSQSVMSRVRTLVTPAAAVDTFAEGRVERSDRGSTIRVSGRVLTPQVRRAVETSRRAVDAIDLVVTDDRCSSVRIDLVCAYGADLQHEGGEVRRAAAAVLRMVLGDDPLFDVDRDIEVRVVDVVDQDPHTI